MILIPKPTSKFSTVLKALGLLHDTRRGVVLTEFGRRLADGGITQDEFAATVVKTLQLPNVRIERDTREWKRARLVIKPLSLVLDILDGLYRLNGPNGGYLTLPELVGIIIPLAGAKGNDLAPMLGRLMNSGRIALIFRSGPIVLRKRTTRGWLENFYYFLQITVFADCSRRIRMMKSSFILTGRRFRP